MIMLPSHSNIVITKAMKNISKETIYNLIDDICMDLFVYDRQNDDDVKAGAIEKAVRDGIVDIPQIVDRFRQNVINTVNNN